MERENTGQIPHQRSGSNMPHPGVFISKQIDDNIIEHPLLQF